MLFKPHPFAVEAYFKQSLVLTYAVPVATVAARLPPPFTPDVYNGQHAFVAIAFVQTEALRPAGLPAWVGNDFFLAGYRLFVRYQDRRGKRLRGLYILESQTDSWRMTVLGNLMTHYRYRRIKVKQEQTPDYYRVESPTAGFSVAIRYTSLPSLPNGSCFPDWKTARRYAGPLPYTLTYRAQQQEVLVIEGVRQGWQPTPVSVDSATLPWLKQQGWDHAVLASAFVVKEVPYYWKKGRSENWQP